MIPRVFRSAGRWCRRTALRAYAFATLRRDKVAAWGNSAWSMIRGERKLSLEVVVRWRVSSGLSCLSGSRDLRWAEGRRCQGIHNSGWGSWS